MRRCPDARLDPPPVRLHRSGGIKLDCFTRRGLAGRVFVFSAFAGDVVAKLTRTINEIAFIDPAVDDIETLIVGSPAHAPLSGRPRSAAKSYSPEFPFLDRASGRSAISPVRL